MVPVIPVGAGGMLGRDPVQVVERGSRVDAQERVVAGVGGLQTTTHRAAAVPTIRPVAPVATPATPSPSRTSRRGSPARPPRSAPAPARSRTSPSSSGRPSSVFLPQRFESAAVQGVEGSADAPAGVVGDGAQVLVLRHRDHELATGRRPGQRPATRAAPAHTPTGSAGPHSPGTPAGPPRASARPATRPLPTVTTGTCERAIDSLQLPAAQPVASRWPAGGHARGLAVRPGRDIGLGVTDDEAAARFPGYRGLKPYLRLTEAPRPVTAG